MKNESSCTHVYCIKGWFIFSAWMERRDIRCSIAIAHARHTAFVGIFTYGCIPWVFGVSTIRSMKGLLPSCQNGLPKHPTKVCVKSPSTQQIVAYRWEKLSTTHSWLLGSAWNRARQEPSHRLPFSWERMHSTSFIGCSAATSVDESYKVV